MTTLLVEPLITTLSQDFNLKNDTRYSIGAFIPYIYMHNAPAGTFTLSIIKSAVTVFSQSFDCTDIKTSLTTTDNYAHVFYPVIPVPDIQLDKGLYTAEISSSGYTYSSGSFLGWIKQFEDLNNILDYTPSNDGENPLALRLKVFKVGIV